MSLRDKIVAAALKRKGYKEGYDFSGNWVRAGYTPFGANYDKRYGGNQGIFTCADWCAMFKTQVYAEAGLDPDDYVATASAGNTGVGLITAKGLWRLPSNYAPEIGDAIYFTWGHVGIVTACKNGKVYTCEGNYNDMVATNCYSLSYSGIRGYERPRIKDKTEDDIMEKGYTNDACLLLKRNLQVLRAYGIIKSAVDDSAGFGTGTLSAVKEVQKLCGITVDGIPGPVTIKNIDKLLKQLQIACSKGQKSVAVYAYKCLLQLARKKGLIKQSVNDDNVFGAGTETATKQVQRMFGLPQTGMADTKTIKALKNKL